jgi:hypothetical protein
MKGTKRLLFLAVIVILLAALPMTVLAAKQIFQASLTTGAELHDVVDSNARGSFTLGFNPDGTMQFLLNVRNLTGAPSGAHIHGPATEEQNAPVLISLCGAPAPSAAGDCTFDPDTATLTLNANITPSLLQQWGITGAQFIGYLNDGLLYVNVHTSLNPAGEVRGQIYKR